MKSRIIITILTLAATIFLTSCQSEQEKLASLCGDLKAVSAMTDDCDKMAKNLAPLIKKFKAENKKLETAPAEADRAAILEAMSVCLSSYLTISTGTCSSHEGVRKAISLED